MDAFRRIVMWLPCAPMLGMATGLTLAAASNPRSDALVPLIAVFVVLGAASVALAVTVDRRTNAKT